MTDIAGDTAPPLQSGRIGGALDRIPTGAKVFLILGICLLPLAIIAFFATIRTAQLADEATRAQMQVTATESARKLAIELVGDMTALRVSLNALESDPGDAPSCARAQGVFAPQAAMGTRFVISDSTGRVICGEPLRAGAAPSATKPGTAIAAHLIPGQGLTLSTTSTSGRTNAAAFFPTRVLAATAMPSNAPLPYEAHLVLDRDALLLHALPPRTALERRATINTVIGVGSVVLTTEVQGAPITSPVLVALLLPIIMWAAAAGISWFVVDRLLIRSLRQLRTRVANFVPGEEIDPGTMQALPAQEIRELGETFRAISRTVAEHEAGLAEGLVRQTKLTREVHHRVKNNLQVISSLINFHARAARSVEATQAYASIQRRVDALAVVHRNHFAELEENRGLSLRSVLGELAANIRATAPEDAPIAIQLDIAPYLANQDVAIAIAFLLTEIIELAMTVNPTANMRISIAAADVADRAVLRINSPALVDNDRMRALVAERYGRVIEGLSRQLRSKLHYDPMVGAYEIAVAVTGRD
ncbi:MULTISPECIES: sensor histidine kinase [unclassified Sphingomonas]|uniref:sensor histidine kinase n=1 Tax=unclassified Sphingomonas TaxID=196159 RepID=UPI002AB35C76|nr:histidine kinase dimerization/phosphoacceptor domain -containing protein [Sphingomonas sp. 10B4]MDY7523229.1 histidine kinase dimerization/phosphoacceptor domain -containing protein [Sphingomonas sp. 10B4]MEB0282699.1 histidine kinase dimerization/phosphoacceptor domain -containing protein [Sphingomonas sp. 10B4]